MHKSGRRGREIGLGIFFEILLYFLVQKSGKRGREIGLEIFSILVIFFGAKISSRGRRK